MKNLMWFAISIVFLMVAVIAFRLDALEESSRAESPPPKTLPTCTNTTIDAYYKCSPSAPIMLRKR